MKNTSLVSMTGFAESTGSHEGLRWRWEAKSVNGRSLDIRLRTPPGFDSLEPPARMLATERFRRGSLQVSLTVEQQEAARGLKVDPAALAAAIKLAREVAAETGLAPARIDGLLALKGVIVQEETVVLDPLKRAQRDAAILKSLADALDALVRARGVEGAKLAALLTGQINDVERLTAEAASLAAAQPEALRKKLAPPPSSRAGQQQQQQQQQAQQGEASAGLDGGQGQPQDYMSGPEFVAMDEIYKVRERRGRREGGGAEGAELGVPPVALATWACEGYALNPNPAWSMP